MAQIHRFRDAVAVYIGDGQTAYLTPAVAQVLGEALIACAKDIRSCQYMDSTFRVVEIAELDGRKSLIERGE